LGDIISGVGLGIFGPGYQALGTNAKFLKFETYVKKLALGIFLRAQ